MFSPRPVLEATAYLRTSRPVEVACSSGVCTRLPTMVILARGREGVVLKARAARGVAATARRARKDMLVVNLNRASFVRVAVGEGGEGVAQESFRRGNRGRATEGKFAVWYVLERKRKDGKFECDAIQCDRLEGRRASSKRAGVDRGGALARYLFARYHQLSGR